MAQIIIEVTDQRKRVFDALCVKNNQTIEQMYEAHMSCVEQREGQIDPSDTPEDQEASVVRLEAKAARLLSEREAAIAAALNEAI